MPHSPARLSARRIVIGLFYVVLISTPLFSNSRALAKEHLGKIDINGLDKTEKKQLHNHLQASHLLCKPGSQKEVVQQNINQEITTAMQALGYFHARWTLSLSQDKHCWQLTINAVPGEALSIRQVRIEIIGEAKQQPAFQRLLAKFTPQLKSRFHSKDYDALKDKIAAHGLNFGYFDARFITQRVDIYPEQNAADIAITWESGPRYRLGDFDIQQTQIDDKLFIALLSIRPGDNYDYSKLQHTQQRLIRSRYFASVNIEPQLKQRKQHTLPIKITATPGNKASYQAGIGFSTNAGPRLRTDYTRHRLNQRGHSANLNFLTSPVLNTVNLGYTMPWLDPKTDTVENNITYINEDNDSFRSERWESSITGNRQLNPLWHQSLSMSYSHERAVIANTHQRSKHLVPALHHSIIQADHLTYPSRGYSLSLSLSGAAEGVFSDSTFLQLSSSAKWITPLTTHIRLLVHSKLGFSIADSIEDIPISRRFFTGGDNSIRGYPYRSLGPVENNEVIGGQHLAVAGIELQKPITNNWSVITFFDAGNAWGIDRFDDSFDPVRAAGLGFRWRSPIGPLRLDLAFPLDNPREGIEKDNFRIHFSLGPEL